MVSFRGHQPFIFIPEKFLKKKGRKGKEKKKKKKKLFKADKGLSTAQLLSGYFQESLWPRGGGVA